MSAYNVRVAGPFRAFKVSPHRRSIARYRLMCECQSIPFWSLHLAKKNGNDTQSEIGQRGNCVIEVR